MNLTRSNHYLKELEKLTESGYSAKKITEILSELTNAMRNELEDKENDIIDEMTHLSRCVECGVADDPALMKGGLCHDCLAAEGAEPLSHS